jgi:hypothetical protein
VKFFRGTKWWDSGRTLHNEDLRNLYASPNIVRVIRSRRTRCAGHVARMGEMRNGYNILVGEFERKRLLGRTRRRWEDRLEWILGKYGGKVWTGRIWFRIWTSGVLL